MMNREAFDEGNRAAGWWLQRLGAFSVERGGQSNEESKRYAIEAVKIPLSGSVAGFAWRHRRSADKARYFD